MSIAQEVGADVVVQRQVRDAYGVVLLLVLVSTLTLIAAGSPLPSPLVALSALFQVGALVITLRVSGFSSRTSVAGSAVFVALFVVVIGVMMRGGEGWHAVVTASWMLLTLTTIAAVLRRVATYKRITPQLVMGLLVVYILLGLTFGLGYVLLELLNSGAFTQGLQGVSGSIYFSFVTLATLGYGDVTPGTHLMRSAAVAEAVVGQLYLVSVVSVAASRLGSVRERIRPEEPK